MKSISVVISVFNGEKYLQDCLSSVQDIATEIIVIDHGSTDATVAIAKKFTEKIYQQENNPDRIDIQKNFGFKKAASDWIFSLDADERVAPELIKEIKEKNESADTAGYLIPRKNIIFNKWIEHTGWYPDYQLRLFKKGKLTYVKKHVHEEVVIEEKVEKLREPIIHENYQTIYQFLHRGLMVYAPNEAEALRANGYVFSYADAIRFPFGEFLSRYFARKGYLDGFYGLMLSLLMSFYHFAIFLYLWESEKFPDNINAQSLLAHELRKTKSEWKYWITSARIEETKNPSSRFFLKTKRKLGL